MQATHSRRPVRGWRLLVAAVALAGSLRLGAELPSRLQVKAPQAVGQERTLSWTFPFGGWTYDVQSQDQLGGPWIPAPAGSGLTAPSWSETRPVTDGGRWYRVVATPPKGERGKPGTTVKVATYNAALLALYFASQGIPVTPTNDVDVYKVTYETIDPYGAPTVVSAALVLPVGAGTRPLLAYAHGTELNRSDVPSSPGNAEGLLGVVMASTGYVTVLPDYLGLGDSRLRHPYHHAVSEATCMVDGMRAARLVAKAKGVTVGSAVFVCGYSQGGHVALATLREIEQRHADEFRVTACAAMAGAYDLSGVTLADALSDRRPPAPYYFAYLLNMLVDLYQVAPSLASMLREPYATTVPPLLDGNHGGDEVDLMMPAVPKTALRPEVLAAVESDPEHPLRRALRDNDLIRWKPVSRLRLYQCSGDEDVPPANMAVAYDAFRAAGATQVEKADPKPGADHGDCFQPALLAAKAWFDTLR